MVRIGPTGSVGGTSGGGGGGGVSPGDISIDPGDIDVGGAPDIDVGGGAPAGGGSGGQAGVGPSGQPDIPDVAPGDVLSGAPGKQPPGQAPTTPEGRQIGLQQRQQVASQLSQVPGAGTVDPSELRTRRIDRPGEPDVIRTSTPLDVRSRVSGGFGQFQQRFGRATAGLGPGRNITARQVGAVVEQQEAQADAVTGALGGVVDVPGQIGEGIVDTFGGGRAVEGAPSRFAGQETLAPGALEFRRQQAEAAREPGPISGPPGQLEQTILGPITGPPSQLERDITGGLEDVAQPVLGPPGGLEQDIGGVFAAGTQGLADLGRGFTEEIGAPVGGVVGEAVGNIPEFGLDLIGEEEAGDVVEGAFEGFGRGLGRVPGEALAAPEGIRQIGGLGLEAGQDVAITAASGDVPEAGRMATFGLAGATLAAGAAIGEEAVESPFEAGGLLVGSLLGGFAAGRAIQRAPAVARVTAARARGTPIFDLEDLSDPPRRVMGGELPGFSEAAAASPRRALEEFREQAAEGELAERLGAPTVFHGRAAEAVRDFGRFGREFEAPVGRSELPGMFFSADLSPLRVLQRSGESGGLGLGLPRPNFRVGRVAAEADPDVGIMRGSTRAEEAAFLTEEASGFRSFIRRGTLTPEQEAIAPPLSRFVASGERFLVRGPSGATVPGRVFLRETGDVFDPEDAGRVFDPEDVAAQASRASETLARTRPTNPFDPVTPTATVTGATAGTATDPFGFSTASAPADAPTAPTATGTETPTATPTNVFTETPSSPFFFDTTATDVVTPTETEPAPPTVTDIFTGGPSPTEPPTSPPPSSPPPTEPPTSPPPSSPPPSGPPSAPPPSGPPTTPPSQPPSRPPTLGPPSQGPPSGPPLIPGSTGGPPPRQPRLGGEPESAEDEEPFLLSEGTVFFNPVATGADVLGINPDAQAADGARGLFSGEFDGDGSPFEGGANPFMF